MDDFRATCELPVDRLRAVAKDMQAQMRVGLAEDGHMLKMLPTFVTQLPSGCVEGRSGGMVAPLIRHARSSERGSWFALDLGGTNFRVLRVTLEEGGVADVTVRSGWQSGASSSSAWTGAPGPVWRSSSHPSFRQRRSPSPWNCCQAQWRSSSTSSPRAW
jgi:Hexokinase